MRHCEAFYSVHQSDEAIEAKHVGRLLDKLLLLSHDNEVGLVWDNHEPSRSMAPEYESKRHVPALVITGTEPAEEHLGMAQDLPR